MGIKSTKEVDLLFNIACGLSGMFISLFKLDGIGRINLLFVQTYGDKHVHNIKKQDE
jgi:hypothetical protein